MITPDRKLTVYTLPLTETVGVRPAGEEKRFSIFTMPEQPSMITMSFSSRAANPQCRYAPLLPE